jgi:hypothetical protein
MCKKLIYLISFILMLGFASSAQAVYVDAKGGSGGNTVNAGTGSTTDWWTTATASDGLWARRPMGNDPNGNLGTAFPADIFEASGAVPSNYTEDCMPIKTTISGLNPGDKYDVSVLYWSPPGSADWNIRAGFALDNMLYFDRTGSGGATAGTSTGRTQADRTEYTGLIGRIAADAQGKIKVYIDDRPATSNFNRTWYDGVTLAPAELTASDPSPPDGAQRVDPNADLVWDPGVRAKQHDVYLGTDISKVTDANRTNDPCNVLVSQDQDANYYPVSGTLDLDYGQTYYWRIDEVNDANIWKGDIWRFTVSFAQAENEIIIFNDNGGWCWYQDERAIINNNKLIIGSIADASGTGGGTRDGDAEVTTYDLTTLSLTRFLLRDALNSDDHAAPAFMVRPDGKILSVYCTHGGDSLVRYRITTNPGDTNSWAAEQTFNVNSNYGATYSNLYRLSSTGITYDFYRGQDYNPNVLSSTDDGASWSIAGRLIRTGSGVRPYAKYASNNTDKVWFTYTDGHPRDVVTNIYVAYLQGGNIYDAYGVYKGVLSPSGGIAPSAGTKIFNADSTHRAWTSDMQLDAQGRPVVAYSVRVGTVDIYNDHRYRYARFDGTSWHDYEIAYAGQCLYTAENDYTGLISLNPSDPNTVYISTNADPVTGAELISQADGHRHYEIFKGQTDDYGASWGWTPITMDSTLDNIRPIVPIDTQHPEPLTVLLWMRGSYYSYTNYDTDIVGIFENLTCAQLINLGHQLDGDISGPAGEPDCYVNLYDLAAMAANWQLCNDPIVGDISGAAGEPDSCVDVYDLAAMVTEWLVCNDPQGTAGSCINPFE